MFTIAILSNKYKFAYCKILNPSKRTLPLSKCQNIYPKENNADIFMSIYIPFASSPLLLLAKKMAHSVHFASQELYPRKY
jgi:hypothetical protein